MHMQYSVIFMAEKIDNFELKISAIFLIFALNLDCGSC